MKDIEWTCDICEETLDETSYVTKVSTFTGEVIKAEDFRVIDFLNKFPPEHEHLCRECFVLKYKDPVENLRVVLKQVASIIELLEAESNDDFYNPKQAMESLNELVLFISDNLPVKVEIERASQRPVEATI